MVSGEVEATDQPDLGVLTEFLKARSEPIEVDVLLSEADRLGVRYSSPRDLRRRVRDVSPHVQWPVRSQTVWWSDQQAPSTAVDRPPIASLLGRWVTEVQPSERFALEQQIETQVSQAAADPTDTVLAVAAGAIRGDVDWSRVGVDAGWPLALTECLVTRATAAEASDWLVDAATALSGSKPAIRARDALLALDAAKRNEVAVRAIERWTSGGSLDGVAAKVRRLGAVVGDEPTTLLIDRALDASVRLQLERKESAETLNRAIVRIAFLVAAAPTNSLARSINRNSADPEALGTWLATIATCSDKERSLRLRLLDAVGRSSKRRALLDPKAFSGLDLDDFGLLFSADWAESLLRTEFVDVARSAVRRAAGVRLGPLLAAASRHPALEALLPLDLLERLLVNDEPSSRLARQLIERAAARFVDEEQHRDRELLEQARGDAEAERHRANDAERAVLVARRQAEDADEQLRGHLSAQLDVRDVALRQAQLDVLRALVELIEATSGVLGPLGRPPVLLDHVADATRKLRDFGVEIVGTPGSIEPYDRRVHEPLDLADGTPVEVISSAYVLGSIVTPLVYGRVRQARDGG